LLSCFNEIFALRVRYQSPSEAWTRWERQLEAQEGDQDSPVMVEVLSQEELEGGFQGVKRLAEES